MKLDGNLYAKWIYITKDRTNMDFIDYNHVRNEYIYGSWIFIYLFIF